MQHPFGRVHARVDTANRKVLDLLRGGEVGANLIPGSAAAAAATRGSRININIIVPTNPMTPLLLRSPSVPRDRGARNGGREEESKSQREDEEEDRRRR